MAEVDANRRWETSRDHFFVWAYDNLTNHNTRILGELRFGMVPLWVLELAVYNLPFEEHERSKSATQTVRRKVERDF